jgi:hypothetical protein
MEFVLDVGDYHDNAVVLTVGRHRLKDGSAAEAACMLSRLRSYICENSDPKSERWLLPQIEQLLAATGDLDKRKSELK